MDGWIARVFFFSASVEIANVTEGKNKKNDIIDPIISPKSPIVIVNDDHHQKLIFLAKKSTKSTEIQRKKKRERIIEEPVF